MRNSCPQLAIRSRSIDPLIRIAGIGQCGRVNSRLALMEGFKLITIDAAISQTAVPEDATQLKFTSIGGYQM